MCLTSSFLASLKLILLKLKLLQDQLKNLEVDGKINKDWNTGNDPRASSSRRTKDEGNNGITNAQKIEKRKTNGIQD